MKPQMSMQEEGYCVYNRVGLMMRMMDRCGGMVLFLISGCAAPVASILAVAESYTRWPKRIAIRHFTSSPISISTFTASIVLRSNAFKSLMGFDSSSATDGGSSHQLQLYIGHAQSQRLSGRS